MAKTTAPSSTKGAVTSKRAGRLYRLLVLLGGKPQTRAALIKRLKLNLRGFYRDLVSLRALGVVVHLTEGRYALEGTLDEALDQLPFPDPGLTWSEALALAKGRTAAHRKLKAQIDTLSK